MSDGPILICYAGTDDDRRAIDAAATLLRGRRAVVLNVAPAMTPSESFAAATSLIPGNAFEDLNSAGAGELARAGVELAVRAGFDADARGDTARSTWEGIVDVADEIDAALIVIGSHRLVPVRRLLERSVSHDVSEHARRPVLIVPPPQ